MKIVGVVILYYPDLQKTVHNIEQYISNIDTLIIWNNTPNDSEDRYQNALSDFSEKIKYMTLNRNMGIGYALNKAIEWGERNNYSLLLTMDQDSFFEHSIFEKYTKLIKEKLADSCDESIAVFSPNLSEPFENSIFVDVMFSITSGSIYRLDVFGKVGKFREDFFIDGIDTEFCLKARTSNYRTVIVNPCKLIQTFGIPQQSKWGFVSTNYSPFRTYHMVRNHVILRQLYPELFSLKESYGRYVLKRMIKIFLSENNKKKKIIAIWWGICDGIKNNITNRYTIA